MPLIREAIVLAPIIDVLFNLFSGLDLQQILGSIMSQSTTHDLGSILSILADFYGGLFN